MTPETLRRKLQKKAKRKEYRKCPRCGGRCVHRVKSGAGGPELWKACEAASGCGYTRRMYWTGAPG